VPSGLTSSRDSARDRQGWKFGTQTVLVDNVRINDKTFTFDGHDQGDSDAS
jgi:hypothetical protein